MWDKHSNGDPTSTGPDYYFENGLQYPDFRRTSSSPLSIHNGYPNIVPSVSYYSLPLVIKDDHNKENTSLNNSPGSNGTLLTSECTDDDMDSLCGSLTYSVESWNPQYNVHSNDDDEIDEGYHAEGEDEDTAVSLGRSYYSTNTTIYYDDAKDSHCDCLTDSCFLSLSMVQAWFQKSLQKVVLFHRDITVKRDYEDGRMISRKRLPQKTLSYGQAKSGTKHQY